jgi:hypothetical protein
MLFSLNIIRNQNDEWRGNNKHKAQLEPQADNWKPEFDKLEGKNEKSWRRT